ncbi:MAG TPA: iron-sulfur cluster assembly scaffold protein [Steroidobacteraceae bacterium]|nr:iron-sulfur cluster assembly scaffold protein [Steroidobacteraceae bacterium]
MSEHSPYSDAVARLFRETPGAGRPDGPGWANGEAREPLSATHVRWHLQATGGRVAASRYEVRGCPHTIAAAALIANQLAGRPLTDLGLDLPRVAALLGCPAAKFGRLFVIQDAIARAAHVLAAEEA